MKIIPQILIALIAIEHLFFLWLEMFAWETKAKRIFRGSMAEGLFKPTRKLAANQGLYNGFLAAGLLWTFLISNEEWKTNISLFFLCCVLCAGLYGAWSVGKIIFFVQGLPALFALLLLLLVNGG
ncbi:MAG: DUF1304 domain-containing protein [Bacteroidetes bacterium]|nr:DUF1304 domain-containing protein [Bacteroidota bacterium]MBS1972852.1 DUF1304 domain-containing protein [Bacteroidota bacterium]